VKVGFIGLGTMGYPMAGHVAAAHDLVVWNRTASVADRHAEEHSSLAAHDLAGLADRDVVVTCLPTSADVDEIADRLGPLLARGSVWVDATSGDPEVARLTATRLTERGVAYVDAPVSGGSTGASAGTLTVMCGGSTDDIDRARPVVECWAGRIVRVGDIGAGHAVKAVNNALLAVALWSAGEGLAALAKAGVDVTAALEVINASSGRSNATVTLIPDRVVSRAFPNTFSLPLLVKDLGIAVGVATRAGVDARVLRLAAERFGTALERLGDVDHTAALRVLEEDAGVEIR